MQRTAVLEEHQAATKTTIAKRRQIERLKSSNNIRPDRVDEALEELDEVRILLVRDDASACARAFNSSLSIGRQI
jgi:hypothetical protein